MGNEGTETQFSPELRQGYYGIQSRPYRNWNQGSNNGYTSNQNQATNLWTTQNGISGGQGFSKRRFANTARFGNNGFDAEYPTAEE